MTRLLAVEQEWAVGKSHAPISKYREESRPVKEVQVAVLYSSIASFIVLILDVDR